MSVFEEFRQTWRQTVENFWRELEADGPGDRADAAYREVGRVRNQLDGLNDAIAETRQRMAHEAEQVKACTRRERLAREIGDDETARIAAEYRDRHQERADVLRRKLDVLEAERRLCLRDLEEMERALQEGRVSAGRSQVDDLERHPSEDQFRNLEDSHRDRTAEERLEELKRRMNR